MNDVQKALSHIADIRAHLATSIRFQGFVPEASALAGVLALVLAVAQTIWPETLARTNLHYVAVWGGFTIAYAVIVVATGATSRARWVHGQMANTMLSAELGHVLPFAMAGVVITFVICKFSPGAAWLLPGLWQILIGLLGFSSLSTLPRGMVWVSGWYFMCGSIVMALAGLSGTLSPWMMGLPIVVGQPAVAFILYRASGECDGQA